MIAKAKAIAHGVVSLNYITRKGDAPVVKLNHLPSDATPQAIWAHMHLKQMLREQELQCRPLKNNLIRMEISPSKEESKGWTLDDWRQFVDEYVQAFDAIRLYKEKDLRRPPCYLSNSQYIVTLHTDSDSGIPHLHLDCNRVDMDGNLNTAQPNKPGSKYTPIKSEHPKYSDEYYRILIEKTGDKYKAY